MFSLSSASDFAGNDRKIAAAGDDRKSWFSVEK